MRITEKDVEFALNEVAMIDSGRLVKISQFQTSFLAWEEEIRHNSKELWRIINAMIYQGGSSKIFNIFGSTEKSLAKGEEERRMARRVLTLVFSAVYSAANQKLPRISKKQALEIACKNLSESCYDNRKNYSKLAEMNEKLSFLFIKEVEGYKFDYFSLFAIHTIIETLLKFIPDGNSDKIPLNWSTTIADDSAVLVSENITGVSFDSIGGQEDAKQKVIELASAIRDPRKYKKWGTRPPRGIGLIGPPGTGKTLIAKALAASVNVPFYCISCSDIFTMWYGKSSQRLNDMFAQAKETGGIIFFDEFDAMAVSRDNPTIHEETSRVLSTLNVNMNGFKKSDKVVVFFASNRIDRIDDASIRAGRIDLIIKVGLPDKNERKEIFRVHIKEAEKNADIENFASIDLEILSNETEKFSGADIAEVIRRALVKKVVDEDAHKEALPVSTQDILDEIEKYEHVEKRAKSIGFCK